MKTGLVVLSMVAALIPLGAAAQDAAAEELHIQASFYPYYEFTKNVAGGAATVEQFLPLGVEAHDWEPSISKVQSLQDTDVFVYNGLGLEVYVDRLAQSGDLSHVVFVKASDGLVLISTAGPDEMVRGALEEYDAGHYTAEEAVEAIEAILDDEDIRKILEEYGSGGITIAEALSSIRDVVGGGHAGHGHDHDADEKTGEHDDHGHDEHGHDDHGHDTEGIRGILEEIRDGDTGYAEGLEAIRELVGSEGHDDHGHGDHGDHGDHDEHDHGAFDPHVWLDPVLAVRQVHNIRDALVAADPDNAQTYQNNAAAYASQLDGLHDDYASTLSSCQHDTIVTLHAAFAYMVERYGFDTVSLSGITGTETVSTADIVNLVDYVKANDIEYLLGDDIIDTRALEVIAEETEAQVLTLSPIEGISPGEFESGATYIGKMRENLAVLRTALACQ